jgi:adenylate cyclase
VERKLAAILAADVAGYSRLMEVDEEGTLNALRSHREVVDGLISAHRGRVFNTAGDSVIAEFPSAVEATLCAVEIQREIARRNEPVSKDKRLEFRIGINIGDVMAEGGNLFGDGVNVADRVQKLAAAGGICIARNVHDQLRNKVGFAFESIGEHHVKNIAMPVSIYRVLVDGAGKRPWWLRWRWAVRQHRRVLAGAAIVLLIVAGGVGGWYWQLEKIPPPSSFPSIAVLPFDDLSGDPALAHYSDGVTEDIITMLSRFPDVTVVSRSSSFAYKGKDIDPPQVGRELKVDYVLEGSVQKKGDNLRINAQLIDAHTNLHVWADGYEGSDPSLLREDAITRILAALPGDRGEIRRGEYQRIKDVATADLNEYGYYLRSDEIIMRAQTIEEHDSGGAILLDGLKKFPDSALLRASLAWYYFWRPWQFESNDHSADFQHADQLAREALASQNPSPMVQWLGRKLTAYMRWFDHDFVHAVADAEAAVDLAPYSADTLSFMARVQIAWGNVSRGIEWVQESVRRRPGIWRNTRLLAWAYYLAGTMRNRSRRRSDTWS